MNRTEDLIRRAPAPPGMLGRRDLAPDGLPGSEGRPLWTPYPSIGALMRAMLRNEFPAPVIRDGPSGLLWRVDDIKASRCGRGMPSTPH